MNIGFINMVVIIQRTLEYFTALSSDKNVNPNELESVMKLWEGIGPDNMRVTNDGIKYIVKES